MIGDTLTTLVMAATGVILIGVLLRERAYRARERRALARVLAHRRAQRFAWGGPDDGEPLSPAEWQALDGIKHQTERSQ